jgi:hypothetical protein
MSIERIANKRGLIDMEDNEFDNFMKMRKGGIFDRMKTCSQDAAKSRFSSKAAKTEFMKSCMKKKGKADNVSMSKAKENIKKRLAKANEKRIADNKEREETKERLANPSLTTTETTTETTTPTIPPTTQANPDKKGMGKMLLYGAIGIIALIIGIKIIKK